jgi:hypothetical protein
LNRLAGRAAIVSRLGGGWMSVAVAPCTSAPVILVGRRSQEALMLDPRSFASVRKMRAAVPCEECGRDEHVLAAARTSKHERRAMRVHGYRHMYELALNYGTKYSGRRTGAREDPGCTGVSRVVEIMGQTAVDMAPPRL